MPEVIEIIVEVPAPIELIVTTLAPIALTATTLGGVGPPGATGATGPQGPPGDSNVPGGTYTHTQGIASAIWTINHGLGYRPAIQTFSGGDDVEGEVSHTDANTVVVTFAYAISGIAYLS